MKVKRNKTHRRILRFYRIAFNVNDPFRVIVDGTFLTSALQSQFHVKEQLPKMLEGRTTPMVTGCVMAELRKLGDKALGASIIARGYYRLKCNHHDPISAAECIIQQVGAANDRKLFVATQDADLVRTLRAVPGVPLLRLDGPVPRVEEPSQASRDHASKAEAAKREASAWEKPKLPELRKKEEAAAESAKFAAAPRKKKGPKGANPMSCRKAKPKKKPTPSAQRAGAEGAAAPAEADNVAVSSAKTKRQRSRDGGQKPADGPLAAAPAALAPATAAVAQPAVAAAAAGGRKRQRSRRGGSAAAAAPPSAEPVASPPPPAAVASGRPKRQRSRR